MMPSPVITGRGGSVRYDSSSTTVRAALAQLTRRVLAGAALLTLPGSAAAQQFVTNDAAIVAYRACQLEAWHGAAASWIQPACHFVRGLEMTAGVGFVADDGSRTAEYVIQGKYLFRQLAPRSVGFGVVAGLGVDPASQVRGGVQGVYAFVPVSIPVFGERLVLNGNMGWHFDRALHGHDTAHGHTHEDHGHHAFAWAARADLLLPLAGERFTLLGELFSEDRYRPEYQVGVRSSLIPHRLLADVSWGGHTATGLRGPGWAVGAVWTPPRLF